MTASRLALLLSICLAPLPAAAATWPVSEKGKLQEAVDSAAYGDTVLVAPGQYPRVVLRSGVHLLSEQGPEHTLLKENTQWVVQGQAVDSLAAIEGFTIDGMKGAEGVVYAEESSFRVANCVIRGGWAGVRALYSDLRIEDCTIRDCTNGIYVFESGGYIAENDIQLCHQGMTIVSSNPRVVRNRVTRNGSGVIIEKHSDAEIGGSVATANRIWNNAAVALRNESYEKRLSVRTWTPMVVKVPYNFWGSDCPDSSLFLGTVEWRPWVDETGTRSLDKCTGKPARK
jgi:hypothetical protein